MKIDIANVCMAFSSVLSPLEIMESSEEKLLRDLGVWSVTEKQVWSSAYVRASLCQTHLNQRYTFPTEKSHESRI